MTLIIRHRERIYSFSFKPSMLGAEPMVQPFYRAISITGSISNMKMLKQRIVHYITSNSYYIIYFKEASHGVRELTKRMYSHPEGGML